MKIDSTDLEKDILIVAEIGNNHEGDFALAKEHIRQAAQAGVGAVKFQTIVPDRLVAAADTARLAQLERFRLSQDQFAQLADVARQHNVLFLSTPFDVESARFLTPLVPAFKIASGDNDFFPLLDVVARTGKPIILSTGLLDLAGIRRSCEFVYDCWRREGIRQDLAVLHCVVNYPTAPAHANLAAIRTLQNLGVTVGYSDHTLGIEAAVLAAALGARIIEKHFTLDKNYSPFRDHQLSADPAEMFELVRRVREAVVLLGDGQKSLQEHEATVAPKVRRSIVASRDLDTGTVLSWEDLTWVRPGGGLSPGAEGLLLNKCLQKPVRRGEWLLPEHCAASSNGSGNK